MALRICKALSVPSTVTRIVPCPSVPHIAALQTNTPLLHFLNTTSQSVEWTVTNPTSPVVSCCWVAARLYISHQDGSLTVADPSTKTHDVFCSDAPPLFGLSAHTTALYGFVPAPPCSTVHAVDASRTTSLVFSIKTVILSLVTTENGIILSSREGLHLYNYDGKQLEFVPFVHPLVLSSTLCDFVRKFPNPYTKLITTQVVTATSSSGEVLFINPSNKTLDFQKKSSIYRTCTTEIAVNPLSTSWDSIDFCLADKDQCFLCSNNVLGILSTLSVTHPPITAMRWLNNNVLAVASHDGTVNLCSVIES